MILAVSVKLLVVYGGAALLLFRKISSPAAFASGFTFMFVIIVLKAAGRLYVERTAPVRPVLERKDSR